MDIKFTACPTPRKTPCLMKNEFGEVFLVTDGLENELYVTRITSDSENVETWKSDLTNYEPLPQGTKVEIIN